jgi:hypothetical protein
MYEEDILDEHAHCLSLIYRLVESFVEHWKKSKEHPLKFMMEHTPWYWANYHFSFVRKLSGWRKPLLLFQEVEYKLEILQRLEIVRLFFLSNFLRTVVGF